MTVEMALATRLPVFLIWGGAAAVAGLHMFAHP